MATSEGGVSSEGPAWPKSPTWTADETQKAEYEACGRCLWDMANRVAAKFCKSDHSTVCGYSAEDLAAEAIVHFFLKLKAGKFNKYHPSDMWKGIRKCLYNRMVDIVSRRSSAGEVQAPEIISESGAVQTDEALEILDDGRGGMWGQGLRRSEVRALEEFVESLLNRLPRSMGLLLKLRFGMWRDDDFGSEFPVMGESVPLQALADAGFGENIVAVHRRVEEALGRFRVLAIAELKGQNK